MLLDNVKDISISNRPAKEAWLNNTKVWSKDPYNIPPAIKSAYSLISEHDGTPADPIPYERNMVLEKGKYYTQFDVLYECITDSIVEYDVDLSGLLSLVKVVEQ